MFSEPALPGPLLCTGHTGVKKRDKVPGSYSLQPSGQRQTIITLINAMEKTSDKGLGTGQVGEGAA